MRCVSSLKPCPPLFTPQERSYLSNPCRDLIPLPKNLPASFLRVMRGEQTEDDLAVLFKFLFQDLFILDFEPMSLETHYIKINFIF